MDRHEPEQLNTPAVSEEYSLEDIIREFSEPEALPEETLPVESKPEEPTPIEIVEIVEEPLEVKKSFSDDTMVFKPVHTPPTEPDLDAPMKIAHEGNLPSAKIKEVKPSRKERKKSEKDAPTPKIKEYTPPTVQEKLKECRDGLSMRHVRVLLLTIPVLLSLLVLLYCENHWTFLPLIEKSEKYLPVILLAICSALSYDVFQVALKDLLHLHIGLHTLTCVAVILSVLVAFSGTPAYCAVTSVLLLGQLRALHYDHLSNFHTLRSVCSFEAPMGIFDIKKTMENSDSLRRESGNVADFLHRLYHRNAPRRIQRIYATVMFLLLPLLAYILAASKQLSFIRIWLMLILCSVPAAMALSFVRPFSSIAKRLAKYRGALCGWHGARVFGTKHTIVLSDEDLFPQKNISSNGMKIYGAHKPQRIIAYALAALKIVESPLVNLFQSLLEAQYGKSLSATEYRIYDDGGVGAEIAGDIVLVGSLSFMRAMGVHMPAGTRVRQAVYVSVSGELAGIFAIKYKPNTSTRAGLRDVLNNRNFSIILATRDFLISPELIAAKYELPTDSMQLPSYQERIRIAEEKPKESVRQGALIAKDTFGAFAVTVAAGRTLRISTVASLCLNLFVGFIGLLLCVLLVAWDAAAVASALHIAVFQLLWAFLSSFVSFVILKF